MGGGGRSRVVRVACGCEVREWNVLIDCGLRVHECRTSVSSWRRRGLSSWRCGGCVGG